MTKLCDIYMYIYVNSPISRLYSLTLYRNIELSHLEFVDLEINFVTQHFLLITIIILLIRNLIRAARFEPS